MVFICIHHVLCYNFPKTSYKCCEVAMQPENYAIHSIFRRSFIPCLIAAIHSPPFSSFVLYFYWTVSITKYQLLPSYRERHSRREEFGNFSYYPFFFPIVCTSIFHPPSNGYFQVVVAYNPLGWNRTDIIRIPVSTYFCLFCGFGNKCDSINYVSEDLIKCLLLVHHIRF